MCRNNGLKLVDIIYTWKSRVLYGQLQLNEVSEFQVLTRPFGIFMSVRLSVYLSTCLGYASVFTTTTFSKTEYSAFTFTPQAPIVFLELMPPKLWQTEGKNVKGQNLKKKTQIHRRYQIKDDFNRNLKEVLSSENFKISDIRA